MGKASMQKHSPFSPDFSPHIPDFSPFSPDFSPSEFRLHSSVLVCSVVCSQLWLLNIMIIGDRRRRSTRKATKSHLKMEIFLLSGKIFLQKLEKNVVFQTGVFSMKNGGKSGI
jgi:hypothetical protein